MNWCAFDLIGKTFGEERVVPEFSDPDDFDPGLIVDGGICYIRFFRKLFIPCFVRSENVSRGVCSPRGFKDPSQRCSERKKKHRKRRSACYSRAPPVAPPKVEEKPPANKIEVEPPKTEPPKPPEPKPPQQPIPCPNCNKPTTIIICDSCNRCHKVQCGS